MGRSTCQWLISWQERTRLPCSSKGNYYNIMLEADSQDLNNWNKSMMRVKSAFRRCLVEFCWSQSRCFTCKPYVCKKWGVKDLPRGWAHLMSVAQGRKQIAYMYLHQAPKSSAWYDTRIVMSFSFKASSLSMTTWQKSKDNVIGLYVGPCWSESGGLIRSVCDAIMQVSFQMDRLISWRTGIDLSFKEPGRYHLLRVPSAAFETLAETRKEPETLPEKAQRTTEDRILDSEM